MFRNALDEAAKTFGLELNAQQSDQFELYYRLVIDWNRRVNLTAITEPYDFAVKHIIDSLSIIRAEIELDNRRVIDVGTGAGFPGIPLKIFFPSIKLTLLDSLNKRINFLSTAINELNLDDVNCVHARAEDAAHSHLREAFDIVTSRAVARLNVLTEYCLPFAVKGGTFIAFKSSNVDEELDEARTAIKILGGRSFKPISVTLPNGDPRTLVLIKKISPTPEKFPRKSGTPEKKPI